MLFKTFIQKIIYKRKKSLNDEKSPIKINGENETLDDFGCGIVDYYKLSKFDSESKILVLIIQI